MPEYQAAGQYSKIHGDLNVPLTYTETIWQHFFERSR